MESYYVDLSISQLQTQQVATDDITN